MKYLSKTLIVALAMFSATLFSQSFNRSLFNSVLQYTNAIFTNDNGTYQCYSESGDVKLLRYDSSGTVVDKVSWSLDNANLLPFDILEVTDSTLSVYGYKSIEGQFNLPSEDSLFVARFDKALNLLNYKVLHDSDAYPYDHDFFEDGRLLLVKRHGFFILDHDLSVLMDYRNNGNGVNSGGLSLNSDSVLIKSNFGQYIVDLNTGNNSLRQILPQAGGIGVYDFSDSSFCSYNLVSGMLVFYNKDDFTRADSLDLDAAVGFQVNKIEVFENNIITSSQNGSYAVLDKQNMQVLRGDTLLTKGITAQYFHMHNETLSFSTTVGSCKQTHIEVFSIDSTEAEPFGKVSLKPTIIQAQILGKPVTATNSSFDYTYTAHASVDLWIENNTTKFLDSLSLVYSSNPVDSPCGEVVRLALPSIDLQAMDSVMISVTDTFKINTNDTNTAVLKLSFEPAVANGNIVFHSTTDTIERIFTGLELNEVSRNNGFNMYPSPAHDEIRIKVNKSESIETVAIYSLAGKLLMKKKVRGSNVSLAVGQLAKGSYLLSFQTDKSRRSQIFRKE